MALPSRSISRRNWWLLAILLLALFLRFHNLGAQSFWNDEGNSARLSERSLRLILEGTASDVHPPLYYLLLRGWRVLVGETEFALRALSAFAGVLVVALVVPFGRALNRARAPALTAGVAALLVALNPAHVYYSQELRMYTLLPLWALLATVLLRRNRLAYAGSVAAGLYTHYFFPVVVGLHGILIVIQAGRARNWMPLRRWLPGVALGVLLYAPWLPLALRPLGGNRGAPQAATGFLHGAIEFLAFGRTLPSQLPLFVWAVLLVLTAALTWRRLSPVRALSFWAFILAPPAALLILDATDGEFYKFLLFIVPALAWPVAYAITPVLGRRGPVTLLLPALALTLLAVPTLRSLDNLYRNPAYARADYRSMAARIAAAPPDAAVILNAPNQWEVFTYYFRDVERVYPLPRGYPDAASLHAELDAITGEHRTIYALFWGDGQQDPDAIVETWLNRNTVRVQDRWVGDVRFVRFAVPSATAEAPTVPVDIRLGDRLTLTGYAPGETTLRPGELAELTLFWRADAAIETRYKVFLHLLDGDGALVAQRDSEPQGGSAPTTAWQPGEQIADPYGIPMPPDATPGRYLLVAGMYNAADPTDRLLFHTGDGAVDALPLFSLDVIAQP